MARSYLQGTSRFVLVAALHATHPTCCFLSPRAVSQQGMGLAMALCECKAQGVCGLVAFPSGDKGFACFAGCPSPGPCSVAMSGAGGTLDQLKMERQELKRKAGEVRAQMKRAKRLEESAGRAWQLSVFMTHVVLIAYSLCNYATPAAVKYLASTGRRRRWPERPEAELHELVENVFLECDPDELAELASIRNPKHPEAFAEAVKYSERWELAGFVAQQNEDLGIAPSTESLLDRWNSRRAIYPEAVRPPDAGSIAEVRGRLFGCRFRKHSGVKHGALRVRDDIPVPEMRDKAGELFTVSQTGGHEEG
jgi:hypothetical protein